MLSIYQILLVFSSLAQGLLVLLTVSVHASLNLLLTSNKSV